MATIVRNTDPTVALWASAHNALKAQIGAGSSYHLDAYETPVAAPAATDLPSCIVMLNALRSTYVFHCSDTLALKVADTTNTVAAAALSAVDLPTSITMANQIKAAYEAHRVSTTFHYTADSTDVESAANATDLPSLITLVNDLKAKLNTHMASAPAAASIRVVAP